MKTRQCGEYSFALSTSLNDWDAFPKPFTEVFLTSRSFILCEKKPAYA